MSQNQWNGFARRLVGEPASWECPPAKSPEHGVLQKKDSLVLTVIRSELDFAALCDILSQGDVPQDLKPGTIRMSLSMRMPHRGRAVLARLQRSLDPTTETRFAATGGLSPA